MVNFRRNYVKGAYYFFTVTLTERSSDFLVKHINFLKHAINKVKQENIFEVNAIVILPDHIHTIWKLPENDDNYSLRWRKIKSYFTLQLAANSLIRRNNCGKYTLWQRRFWEHTIRNDLDYKNHVNYIHYNPVKHGLVHNVADWPYSSFHRFVKKGLLPPNWGNSPINKTNKNYGE